MEMISATPGKTKTNKKYISPPKEVPTKTFSRKQ